MVMTTTMMNTMKIMLMMMVNLWLETPRDGEWAQRDTTLKLIAIHFAENQNGVDGADLWQTVQLGPSCENQAQQLHATILISKFWGNRVD